MPRPGTCNVVDYFDTKARISKFLIYLSLISANHRGDCESALESVRSLVKFKHPHVVSYLTTVTDSLPSMIVTEVGLK